MKKVISREKMEVELEHWRMGEDVLAEVRAGRRGVTRNGFELWVEPRSSKSVEREPEKRRDLFAEIHAEIARERAPNAPARPFVASEPVQPAPVVRSVPRYESGTDVRRRLQREADARKAATQGKRPGAKLARLLDGGPKDAA